MLGNLTETGGKTIKLGVLSSINLPVKSHKTPKANERPHIDKIRDINNKQETQDEIFRKLEN